MHIMGAAHFLCMNNQYEKFEYKGMRTVGVADYTNQTPPTFWDGKMSMSNTYKKKKIFIKWAENGRCTSFICEQPLCKV